MGCLRIVLSYFKKILLDRRYDTPLSIYSRFIGMTIIFHNENYFPLMDCYGINTKTTSIPRTEITEMMENFTKLTKYLTKLKDALINYVKEKYQVLKQ